MGVLLNFVQQAGAWAVCPPRYTKCNSPSINGQCTNFILFSVATVIIVPVNSSLFYSSLPNATVEGSHALSHFAFYLKLTYHLSQLELLILASVAIYRSGPFRT